MSRPNRIQIIKYAPPPPELPVYGSLPPENISYIGRTNYVAALEEKKFIFGIKRVDRRRHLYVVGKSGTGKSKLLELFVRQDIAHGYGCCLIDPHGELVHDIIDFVPKERAGDVCVIDPTDVSHPISWNPFQNVDPAFRHQLTQGFVEVLSKHFGPTWSSRIEHVFRYVVSALLDYPHATMRGMINMLTDAEYRQAVVSHIEDDMVKRFWEIEFDEWAHKYDADALVPLRNKLGQFLSDPMLRPIFEQEENKIELERLMNENKVILLNLAKGEIGEDNASFLGALFLIKIKQAGMARARESRTERKDFYLYVDEFQNVVTDSFESILSESRKYGIAVVVAHQYIGQLSKKIQHAVLGNAGTIVCFRLSGEDATTLRPEFAPVFDIKDMINLGIGEFYIKTTIDGESYDPFSAETLKVLPSPNESSRDAVMTASRERYTHSRRTAT